MIIQNRLNIIPTMTSNTAPSGVANASNISTSSYDAWKAFDDAHGSGYYWRTVAGVTSGWLSYKFENPKLVDRYGLISATPSLPASMPKNWTFEGSNNGSDWTVLDTQVNVSFNGGEFKYFEFINSTPYSEYRINISSTNGNNFIGIGELELFDRKITLNKTLILHNDEYKKFIEATEYKAPLYSDNIIPIMTSNTAPSGIAMASSELTDRGAYKAFNDTNGTEGGWSTNSTTSGWIYYKFPESKIISKYTIQAFDSSTYINRAPKTWTFEGSNDGDVWNVLDTVNNFDGFVLGSATHEFTFVNSTPYLYYRLNVSANNGNASYLQINRLTMHEISQKEIPKSNSKWVIISDILPTVNQFVDNGMDSLTPLLDRKVRKLEPQVMIQDSTPVGNGKVYRKKVNLNKYFDIRTISTETRKS